MAWHGFKEENKIINTGPIEEPIQNLSNWVSAIKAEDPAPETDPSGRPLNTPGAKADAGKLRPFLVLGGFARALKEVTKVGTLGAAKYTDNGWITVPNGKERYMDAAMRHILAAASGEKYDNGTGGIGTKHLANACWCILATLELEEREESIS